MTASSRAARAGLLAYAGCLVVELLLGLWSRHLIASIRDSEGGFTHIEAQLDLVGYGYVGLGIGAVVALAATRSVPRASRVAVGAAVAAGLSVLLELAQRVFLSLLASGSGVDRIDGAVRLFGAGIVLADMATRALVLVLAVRIGREASSRAATPLALAAFVVLATGFAMSVVTLTLSRHAEAPAAVSTIETVAYYLATVLVAAAAVHAGWSASRVPEVAPPASHAPGVTAALSPAWGRAASGIGLYLGGAAARVVCALLGYAVLAGGSGGSGTPDLHGMHDGVLMVAVLSGAASLTMLVGVWRITRAPPDSGGAGPAMVTLCLMILGLTLDLATTSITLDALGGSLSAAFFAMDALPLLAGGAALLGVGAGVALLLSFANMAHALGARQLTARARSAVVLLVIAGGVAGLAAAGLKHLPTDVLALLAVALLPVAVAALVQFLRVALPLRQLIASRLERP